jgi:hypothetical protein
MKELKVSKHTQEKFAEFFSEKFNIPSFQNRCKQKIQSFINKGYETSEIRIDYFLLADGNEYGHCSFYGISAKVSVPRYFIQKEEITEGLDGRESENDYGTYMSYFGHELYSYSYNKHRNQQGSILKNELLKLLKDNESKGNENKSANNEKAELDFGKFLNKNIIWIGLALWIIGYLISKVF